jgi:beta-fructofuranosidase
VIDDPQRWIWDSWYTKDGDDYHAFFLAAPRSLGDPDQRHWSAVAAHAVSTDLREWRHLPDALVPGEPGRFDDQAIWTGSVVKDGDVWRMFYTGIDATTRGARQRVGHAISHDLVTWTRVSPDPVAIADPRWYSTFDRDGVEAFRDPWVFRHTDGRWHMLVTATDLFGHGCIGHATSDDLLTWVVEEPLAIKTGFLQLEVLQVHTFGETPVLFFSCLETDISLDTVERRTGYYSAPADSALGPFALDRAEPMNVDGIYAGRVVETPDGPVMMGFRNVTATRPFEGVIGAPIPLELTSRGTVNVRATP